MGLVLGSYVVLTIIWVVWMEMNKVFLRVLGNHMVHLRDEVQVWTSLWASVSLKSREWSLNAIYFDCAVCKLVCYLFAIGFSFSMYN